jgi:CDP-diacylglycerol--serine O-phosphatidyltransferase
MKNSVSEKKIKAVPLPKLVPNMITILGLCLGISAIRYALDAKWQIAAGLILIAAFLDGIDGRLARFLNSSSSFGAQLDSIADMASFGVAPAVTIYLWSLYQIPYKGVGWAITLFFITCSALRLARFNSKLENKEEQAKASSYFTGLPMPSAAGFLLLPMILTFDLMQGMHFSYWAVGAYMIIIGLMMISRIPTFSGKKANVKREYVPMVLLVIGMVIAGAILEPWIILPLVGVVYLISIPCSIFSYYKQAPVVSQELPEASNLVKLSSSKKRK